MEIKITQKTILRNIVFACLIILALILDNFYEIILLENSFFYRVQFTFSICIYIGIYSYWVISVYRRIMQKHVRNYLLLIGASIIFWITIRTIKWAAFEFVIFEDRILWYMYYIPMILLCLFFLFISLYVGENEDYRPSKKWKLLYIPAILLMVAVLANDLHGLAFNIDISIHAHGQDYSHGPVYYIVFFYILSIVIMSTFIIMRKFSISKQARRKAVLPALVIAAGVLYTILYIITPSYGIGYYLDLTVFGCTMAIILLESFITTGLIQSNIRHKECFAMTKIRAQILNNEGEVYYMSDNTLPITKADFEILKKDGEVSFSPGTLSHITPITGGYILWNSDVFQIDDMIKKLKELNDKLYKEVDILTLENEQKSERARLRKLNDLHSLILKEILPSSEKMKLEIECSKKTKHDELWRLLFETSMTSIYIKRKVSLIFTEQTEKYICLEDMRYCFLESFQLLRLYDKTCAINIIDSCNLSLGAAMASLDLYQNIIEGTKYNFDTVYVTYNFDDENITFVVQISGDIKLCFDDLTGAYYDTEKGGIKLLEELDSYYISLVIPRLS